MNPLKKLLGQTAVYGLSTILGRTLNYLLVPLYTSVFDKHPEEYGVVSQLYAFVAFLMILLTFGMETTYFRFIQDSDNRKQVFQNSFLTVVLLNIAFFLGIFTFDKQIANALLFDGHVEYIILMGAIVVIDAMSSLPLAKLRAEEKAKQFAIIQFSSIGANIFLNVVLLLFFVNPEDPKDGVFFILIANLISSFVKPLFLRKDFREIRFKVDFSLLKKMLVYAIPIVIAGFAGIINEVIDRIMLKQMLYDPANGFTAKMADAEIGIYSACYKLAMLVTILLQAYRYAAEPFFFNQMKNQERNKLYVKLMNYFMAIVCVVFLGVSLNLEIFKYFISSKTYWEGLKIVPVLLLANVFLGIYFNQSIWYKLTNQTRFGAYISIMGAVLTIGINYLFIPKFGYVASAWATMIVYAFQMTISYLWGQKHFPIKYNLRKFFLYLGLSILLYFVAGKIPYGNHTVIRFIANNLLIAFYIYIVLSVEGVKLSALRKR
ncbi:oligosaccharide flippase family protein [Fluviicola sp.]|uniref:oligosaccharide flippase family protein n=1 Tax=Fluviicola sp. TaxID=1917219 RepID=UPI002837F871|nr:oligosaccharide flippase family protein [Fluviicola sp.]MDR0802210.1 oligosaccharide flippase family protein [Fluviicola sp.]